MQHLCELLGSIMEQQTQGKPAARSTKDSSPRLGTIPESPPISQNLRILVAEDNIFNQVIIRRMLTNLGHTDVEVEANGKKALERVKQKKFDVVLMDIMMPEMGGIEATERIRSEVAPEQQPTSIIALTADVFVENREKCLKCGMKEVIHKPVDMRLLKDALVRCCPFRST